MNTNEVTEQNVEQVFSYHKPHGDQASRYIIIREHAKKTAQAILSCCPRSADRSAALRCLREAVMWANASIALEDVGALGSGEKDREFEGGEKPGEGG